MYSEHFRLPALCFWVMWGMRFGQHSACDFCDMNVSQAQVTRTCLGMCACVLHLCLPQMPLLFVFVLKCEKIWAALLLIIWVDFVLQDYLVPVKMHKHVYTYIFRNTTAKLTDCLVERPAVEVPKGSADRESSPPDLHSFQHPRVSQLIQNHIGIKLVGLL